MRAIEEVIDKAGSNRTLAWRGQVNSDWNLHSGLYRRLPGASGGTPAPTENVLLAMEKRIFEYVRSRWRFDHMPYLQLLAQLQHFRAPTRMLDVSLSPFIGLWFALERQYDANEDADGRIFAFDVSNREIGLRRKWTDYEIPWATDATGTRWCFELPLFWRPPAYNERIPAQHSGFLLAGVPKYRGGANAQYRKGPGISGEFWRIDQVRHATSVPTRLVGRERNAQERSEPTFTLRIEARAKEEIRSRLERHHGINSSTMYPDAFGMAKETQEAIDHGLL
jgi:hypothetical protein